MKRLIAILLSIATPSWATWTAVQSVGNTAGGAITVSALGAGNLIVARGGFGATAQSLNAPTGGCAGTWTHSATCLINSLSPGSNDIYYCLNATGGATSITMNGTAAFDSAQIFEYSTTSGPPIFDGCTTKNNASSVTTIAAPAATLTGSNDVIVQTGECSSAIASISGGAGFTSPAPLLENGDAAAGAINTANGAAPTWTQTAGTDNMTVIAFKETAAAAASGFSKQGRLKRYE